MKKEEVYLDTRLLSVEERKNLVKILEDNGEAIYPLTKRDLSDGKTDRLCPYLRYSLDKWEEFNVIDNKLKRISYNEFLSLFNPLQIGQTFEYNGFICEVKEPVKKWYYNPNPPSFYKKSQKWREYWVEITDQEFISQLEKHSK